MSKGCCPFPFLLQFMLCLVSPNQQCSRCPVSTPLSIVITEAGAPVIALEANKATVKLPVRILVFTNLADGTVLTVLALEAVSIARTSAVQTPLNERQTSFPRLTPSLVSDCRISL